MATSGARRVQLGRLGRTALVDGLLVPLTPWTGRPDQAGLFS